MQNGWHSARSLAVPSRSTWEPRRQPEPRCAHQAVCSVKTLFARGDSVENRAPSAPSLVRLDSCFRGQLKRVALQLREDEGRVDPQVEERFK